MAVFTRGLDTNLFAILTWIHNQRESPTERRWFSGTRESCDRDRRNPASSLRSRCAEPLLRGVSLPRIAVEADALTYEIAQFVTWMEGVPKR